MNKAGIVAAVVAITAGVGYFVYRKLKKLDDSCDVYDDEYFDDDEGYNPEDYYSYDDDYCDGDDTHYDKQKYYDVDDDDDDIIDYTDDSECAEIEDDEDDVIIENQEFNNNQNEWDIFVDSDDLDNAYNENWDEEYLKALKCSPEVEAEKLSQSCDNSDVEFFGEIGD